MNVPDRFRKQSRLCVSPLVCLCDYKNTAIYTDFAGDFILVTYRILGAEAYILPLPNPITIGSIWLYLDGLVQERRNSIANALEFHFSCNKPSIRTGVTSFVH